jgi:hypothetical protein
VWKGSGKRLIISKKIGEKLTPETLKMDKEELPNWLAYLGVLNGKSEY